MRRVGLVVSLVVLAGSVSGCLSDEGPPEAGVPCSTFDPAPPAAQVHLATQEGHEGAPPNASFTLEVYRLDDRGRRGDRVARVGFPEGGCVGVGLADQGPGTYEFWAEAEDPEDAHCSWFDGKEREIGRNDLVDVTVVVGAACT